MEINMAVLLHLTDMQGDFGATNGGLFVPGGDGVATRINTFLDALEPGMVDASVVTFDTHFWFSYFSSPECIPFPAIHCENGKEGWDLVIDTEKLSGKTDVYYGAKETFDFWQDKATNNVDVRGIPTMTSNMAYMQFQSMMNDKGAQFLSPDVDRDTFGKAVGHDFDATLAPFGGKVTVYSYPQELEGKVREGFYVANDNGDVTVYALVNETQARLYNNIGQMTSDAECTQLRGTRDQIFNAQNLDGHVVAMTGLASNFCVFDAMLGYLERGAHVVVLEDLMAGIPNGVEAQQGILDATGVDRTATGDINDVLKTSHFADFVAKGKVTVMDSDDFLTYLHEKKVAANLTQSGPAPKR
jgi:nicotinamidase-related amidase